MTRPRRHQLVRVELPRWIPAHRQDELNAVRSELEDDDLWLPIHQTDPAEFDDQSR